jgi:hypothetical protein
MLSTTDTAQAEVAKSSGGRAAPQLQAQMMGNSLVLELEGLVDQVCCHSTLPPYSLDAVNWRSSGQRLGA